MDDSIDMKDMKEVNPGRQSRSMVARSLGKGKWVPLTRHGVFLWEWRKCFGNRGDGCTTLNVLSATELYTLI